MTIKKIKNLKPTEIDVTFKYTCPICYDDHWLRLKQTQLKNHTIACDCGSLLRIKKIASVKVKYEPAPKKSLVSDTSLLELIKVCSNALTKYGFTASEAHSMIEKAYKATSSKNKKELIKFALSNLEINHD